MTSLNKYQVLLLSVLFLCESAKSQYDSLKPIVYSNSHLITDSVEEWPEKFKLKKIEGVAFPSFEYENLLKGLIFFKDLKGIFLNHDDSPTLSYNLTFDRCTNFEVNSMIIPGSEKYYDPYFRFLNGFNLTKWISDSGTTIISNVYSSQTEISVSIFDNLKLINCSGAFKFDDSFIEHSIQFGYCNFQSLEIQNTNFIHDTTFLEFIGNAFSKPIFLHDNPFRNMFISFEKDSLNQGMRFDEYSPHQSDSTLAFLMVRFKDCFINGPLSIVKTYHVTKIIFDHCTFGEKAANANMIADTVEYLNEGITPSTFSLIMQPRLDTCWLKLYNSVVGDRGFLYNSHFHLSFDTKNISDTFTSAYEGLLSKFTTEGKKDSYQRVDIEYRTEKAKRGTRWDKMLDWLEKEWWNYSYSKWLVVIWTLLFLFSFFVINAILWTQMKEVYPIEQGYNFIDREKKPRMYVLQKYVRIFLYTCYIFFSVTLDLPKVKVTNLLLVAFFIFQFIVGLWCLFFILNALLKIG